MGKHPPLPAGLHRLVPHPQAPPRAVEAVDVELFMNDASEMLLCFRVRGDAQLSIGAWKPSARADGLWKTTCFELFLHEEGADGYLEFNFAPTTEWAAYAFDGYRSGMRDFKVQLEPYVEREPELQPHEADVLFALDADVDLAGTGQGPLRMSLAAVIEEEGGHFSYWALAHAPGDPDFHNPACFTLQVPAAATS